ncbi:hypothetical protein SAMN05421741_102118 [Paenimyroides ummariense]|uniref:Uncharacterized protein n=1 Tax=Paenimyroides ummariense TaxID=913024 RepID=A0A1I4X671_9FLAO|nr:hypothetical protein [Paenimyroides ummariense]SFN20926.1 hypothetical protein SAMN05421741_102118 [Paenimyroides ummariense]
MEVVFNEVSFLPYSENEYVLKSSFINMLKVFAIVKEKHGFSHILFPTNIGTISVLNGKSFTQWAYEIQHQGEKNTILSFIKRPFGEDVLEEQIMHLNKFYYHNESVGIIEKYCIGLAIGYLKDKVSISLNTNLCWNFPQISFKEIIDDDFNIQDVLVNNITGEDHISNNDVEKNLIYSGELELIGTPVNFSSKSISLRDDHGKDKLKTFSKRLVKSKYVVSIINSLPFNPNDRELIRKVFPDGKIEIVLHWESAGYGIIIQTTGRNLRETEEIAKIIKENFDR